MRDLPRPHRASTTACVTLALLAACALLSPGAAAEPGGAASAFAAPVDADALDRLRGGHDITHNDLRLDGITAGNTASNVATGTNTIATGAFAGMSGLPLVVQNSGANVLIQNAVIVNVKME